MATLKVKIQEDIVLDNQDYGSKRTLEISSIDEVMKRIVTCAASQTTTIAVFNSNAYEKLQYNINKMIIFKKKYNIK